MTLDDLMRDIQALREDLLIFERKYGVPTEVFYEAYQRGEEPKDPAWMLDWSEWAATYQLLQDRLADYDEGVRRLLLNSVVTNLSELIGRTARHESVTVPA
ncbi:MAG: hypothetical protein WHX53_02440 [Anaerolineae bacterium]